MASSCGDRVCRVPGGAGDLPSTHLLGTDQEDRAPFRKAAEPENDL